MFSPVPQAQKTRSRRYGQTNPFKEHLDKQWVRKGYTIRTRYRVRLTQKRFIICCFNPDRSPKLSPGSLFSSFAAAKEWLCMNIVAKAVPIDDGSRYQVQKMNLFLDSIETVATYTVRQIYQFESLKAPRVLSPPPPPPEEVYYEPGTPYEPTSPSFRPPAPPTPTEAVMEPITEPVPLPAPSTPLNFDCFEDLDDHGSFLNGLGNSWFPTDFSPLWLSDSELP
jgi:hypothetical protein